MQPSRAALFFSLCCAACSSAHDLGTDPAPLVTLRGRVASPLPALLPARGLRVGLVWAATPVFVPYCHRYGPTSLDPQRGLRPAARQGCRDPFDFVPRRAGPSAPIDAQDPRFEIPLSQLPAADLMVGPPEARVAYASLVLYVDDDGDQEQRLLGGCPRLGGRPRPEQELPRPESILTASFSSLARSQLRLTFVEGRFNADSNFYPHPRCADLPPQGFSWWEVGSLLDASATCRVRDVEEPVELAFSSSVSLSRVGCTQRPRESFSRPPDEDVASLLGESLIDCDDDGSIVLVDLRCPCPEARVFSLTGCFDEVDCADPDWDLRGDPPDWWLCPVPRGP